MLDGLGYKHDSEHHQWLSHNKTFENWIRDRDWPSHSRLIWVTGVPGCGKSTAMRGAFHQMLGQQDVREGTHQLAAFFFDNNDELLLQHPDGMYRALLYQILKGQRDSMRRFIEKYCSDVSGDRGKGTHQFSEYDYRGLLLHTLRDNCQHSQCTTIFIDALDECLDSHSLHLDQFFHDIVTTDDFVNLKICVSSRNLGSIRWLWLDELNTSRYGRSVVKIHSPTIEVERENCGAINAYLDDRLRIYGHDATELGKIKQKIQNMAMGIFLWVELITDRLVEDLRKTKHGQLDLRLQPIPGRLKKLYTDVLHTAEDRAKTWRFFQWLFLAPDLSLRAWRDLIPFLQEEPPRSLKKSHNSEDWATGLDAFIGDDSWIQDLERIVCQISCGLAQVARVSDRLERPEESTGDRVSVTGEAGSWYTADGDTRLVRPIHESVRQLFQCEDGFAVLDPTTMDQNGEGLIMAMITCLDFIGVREFSRFIGPAESRDTTDSSHSSSSLLSGGDDPAWTSISRFSSARSIRHKVFDRKIMSQSTERRSLASTEESDSNEDSMQMRPVLVRVNRETEHCSESLRNERLNVDRWRNLEGDPVHPESIPSPPIGLTLQLSGRNREWEIWYSDLLSYILTAFPAFASSAEAAGVDASLVLVKLREGRLWDRWICLSEEIAAETSLKQWAESQQLHSWMRYLTRAKDKTYTTAKSASGNLLGHEKQLNIDVTLNYCFDGGRRFIKRLESLNSARPTHPDSDTNLVATSDSLLGLLEDRLRSAEIQNHLGQERSSFIPYRLLRSILTETVLEAVLGEEAGIAPKKARKVRNSSIRICGVLILINKVPYMKQILDTDVDDRCLPLRLHRHHGDKTMLLISHIPGKGVPVLKGMTANEYRMFEEFQWWFLSPFLAKPAGRLQHYKLGSAREPIPVIQQRSVEEDRTRYTAHSTQFEKDSETKVRFHPDSFDFGNYGVSL